MQPQRKTAAGQNALPGLAVSQGGAGWNLASLLAPRRRFDRNRPELIDRPETDPALVREELEALASANERFGAYRLVLDFVGRMIETLRPVSLSILDLATGAADIPRAIADYLKKAGIRAAITVVDANPEVVRVAREKCRAWPEICIEQHDVLALPHPPNSFDLVLCSMALHHFERQDAIHILRRMHEIARVGYLMNDLRRTWTAVWVTELLARSVIRSRIVQQDAPQSCWAAFTAAEMESMAAEAGLSNFKIGRRSAIFRMVLEGRK